MERVSEAEGIVMCESMEVYERTKLSLGTGNSSPGLKHRIYVDEYRIWLVP